MKGAAAWATLMRSSEDTLGSLMMPNKKSSGDISGFAAAAASAAFLCAVFLFGVPRWRPPRLSPGFDPLGMAIFRSLLFWPIKPLTCHVPFLGRRGPKPQPEAQRHQCAGRLSRAPGELARRYPLRVTEYERTAGPAAVAYDGGAYARPR